MAAAKPTARQNTPTEQNKEDNSLVLYRLALVETAVKDLTKQLAGKENITRADLVEFRNTVLEKFGDKNKLIEKELARLELEKADNKDLADIKGLIKVLGLAGLSVIGSLVVFYLTTGSK